jgi:hypothetical protein
MQIGMAVATMLERLRVDLHWSGSWLLRLHMADGAGHISVLSAQGETGSRMIKPVHCPFLPAAFSMARRTKSMIRPVGKLLPVRIRMTVGAGLKLCDAKTPLAGLLTRLPRSPMTLLALHLLVLCFQRIACH